MELRKIPDVAYTEAYIGGRKYRIPDISADSVGIAFRNWKPPTSKEAFPTSRVEEDEPVTAICGVENAFAGVVLNETDDSADAPSNSVSMVKGRWTKVCNISHHYHKSIFGKENRKLRGLEKQFGCSIRISQLDQITVSSLSQTKVLNLVSLIVEKAEQSSLKFTHFICLPLIGSKEVETSLASLSSHINDPLLRSALVPACKLHFTLCMLKLTTDSDIRRVVSILHTFEGTTKGISVDLRGIKTMNDVDPSHFKVAYTGGVADDGPGCWREQIGAISDTLVSRLADEGLIDRRKQRTFFSSTSGKLHATLFNIKYAHPFLASQGIVVDSSDDTDDEPVQSTEWAPNMGGKSKEYGLDGSDLFRKFKDFRFGRVQVNQIRLCSLVDGVESPKPSDGFYRTEALVQI